MPAAEHSIIANSFGFKVDIGGQEEKDIRDVAIDELNIDCRELTTGVNVEYRVFGPGASHWGKATFTRAVTLGASKDWKQWFDDACIGKGIRKPVTVTLYNSEKQPGRSFDLHDTYPIQYTSVGLDTSSSVSTETLTLSIGRIQFGT